LKTITDKPVRFIINTHFHGDHTGGNDIRALYFPAGLTDGDSIIFFPHSNVVHMGDDFVTYGFPIHRRGERRQHQWHDRCRAASRIAITTR
jgi:glyoxylase-like metal-dependent hydrolase (beta-lactamase superfamily II)